VEASVIIDLPSTTTSAVNSKLIELREQGGVTTLRRVMTLVIVTDDDSKTEAAVQAGNDASREHPCRVLVLARGPRRAAARLDAQIRVGGDAGASEVIVLRLYGPLAGEGASAVEPLLLPDSPIVAWWPSNAPTVPAQDPIGTLAHRRITDAAAENRPIRSLQTRRESYAEGDTDLAWTRLTNWRAVLAEALDLPPYEKITGATVTGEADSPSAELLAAWLASFLGVSVTRAKATSGEGITSVVLHRHSGDVELVRPDGKIGTLTQPGQPDRRVALQRRKIADCLSEELRRLDPDEIYEATLRGMENVVAPRSGSRGTSGSRGSGTKKQSGTRSTAKKSTTSKSGTSGGAGKRQGTKRGASS
jgi:glucose-6-phosphate dehydrogenase assembly protein OpcA